MSGQSCGEGLAQHSVVPAKMDAAREMKGYRELPMGRHDFSMLEVPEVGAAFERFLKLEGELSVLLENAMKKDRELLGKMK
jgi:hypothetical protein